MKATNYVFLILPVSPVEKPQFPELSTENIPMEETAIKKTLNFYWICLKE